MLEQNDSSELEQKYAELNSHVLEIWDKVSRKQLIRPQIIESMPNSSPIKSDSSSWFSRAIQYLGIDRG